MDRTPTPPCILVLFGSTGDLAHRKILPALYNLMNQKWLPPEFAVVCVGRQDITEDEYRKRAYERAEKQIRGPSASLRGEMDRRLFYRKMDLESAEGYAGLDGFLTELDGRFGTRGNRVFYLAVAPEFFEQITGRLTAAGMLPGNASHWRRVVVEKPFGTGLASAKKLNTALCRMMDENRDRKSVV